MVWNICCLIDVVGVLGLLVVVMEQYFKGLGSMVLLFVEWFGEILEKWWFSCGQMIEVVELWTDNGIDKIFVVGIEIYVCIQQILLDLLVQGFSVFVVVDVVFSCYVEDWDFGL